MGPSLYSANITQEIYNRLISSIVSKYTDPDAKMPLLHKELLDPEYSVNGTFASISETVNNFMVDVIATDSKLPLKNREAIKLLNGYLPKLGNKMYFNEQQLQDLDAMVAMGNLPLDELLARLFKDADTLIKGGLLRNEYIFLQGLSKGVATVTDSDNVGVEFVCDYKFLPENKSYATTANTVTLEDFTSVINKAASKGVILGRAFMDFATYNKLINDAGVKAYFNNAKPSKTMFNDFLLAEYGIRVTVVNRVVTAQINGKDTQVKAWASGQITFTTDEKVGKLVWTRTAEFNHRVGGVMYTDADGGIFLVSKYGKNDPVAEFTSIQGRCLPVIGNVQNIYQLDTTKISA